MTELPPELVRLTQLFSHMVFMNFDYNSLSMLPKEVGKLTNLTRLSFNRNRYDIWLLECLRASPQISRMCASGSTIQQYVCSREHNRAVIEIPGTQSSYICAPGSTNKQYLCSRKHNQASCTSTPTSLREKHRRGESDSGSLIPWWSRIAHLSVKSHPGIAPGPGTCAPRSTNKQYLCSRTGSTKQAVFVLPGAELSSMCAPGSTLQLYLWSREHKRAVSVLGAQSSSTCAPGGVRDVL
jgi:hypothetical protein